MRKSRSKSPISTRSRSKPSRCISATSSSSTSLLSSIAALLFLEPMREVGFKFFESDAGSLAGRQVLNCGLAFLALVFADDDRVARAAFAGSPQLFVELAARVVHVSGDTADADRVHE